MAKINCLTRANLPCRDRNWRLPSSSWSNETEESQQAEVLLMRIAMLSSCEAGVVAFNCIVGRVTQSQSHTTSRHKTSGTGTSKTAQHTKVAAGRGRRDPLHATRRKKTRRPRAQLMNCTLLYLTLAVYLSGWNWTTKKPQ